MKNTLEFDICVEDLQLVYISRVILNISNSTKLGGFQVKVHSLQVSSYLQTKPKAVSIRASNQKNGIVILNLFCFATLYICLIDSQIHFLYLLCHYATIPRVFEIEIGQVENIQLRIHLTNLRISTRFPLLYFVFLSLYYISIRLNLIQSRY